MRLISFFCFCCLMLSAALPSWAQMTDLSENKIEIRYSFEGAELILFGTTGALNIQGDYDVVVVVRGPIVPAIVRKKAQKYGVWMNDLAVAFPTAPGYYAVAATRNIGNIAQPEELNRHGIGFDNLTLTHTGGTDFPPAALKDFRKALYRGKSKDDLYREGQDSVKLKGQGLFRTNIYLPSNVPVGTFHVNAYIIQNGVVIGSNEIPMLVSKEGFERAVYDFANTLPFLYGLVAVIIALVAGWLAGMVGLRKS